MRTLTQLMITPRMFYAALCPNNSVGGLLKMVNEIVKPDFTIVEVGSFSGVSSDLFARYCKKLFCIDVWKLGSKGISNEMLLQALDEFTKVVEYHENIIAIQDHSVDAAKEFRNESIDMVYIDAVHNYEDVKEDIYAWMPKVKKGGYVTGHDIQMEGVRMAVEEIFGKDYKTYTDESWMHLKK